MEYGILCLVPVALVIILCITTKRVLESLIIAALVGFAMVEKLGFAAAFIDALLEVISESAWYIMVFGLFGVIITLLENSGGAIGFSKLGSRLANTRRKSLFITWALGIVIFIDDYLNNLAVGVSMRNITDKFKVPREFLAYMVNTTGAAVCVLIPFSTWGVFMATQYEAVGITVDGGGLGAYIKTVPFIFYGWAAVITALLFAFKIIPVYGPMKKAMQRAEMGDVFPKSYYDNNLQNEDSDSKNNVENPKAYNFIFPILALIIVTIVTNDILVGCIVGFLVCLVLYLPQKIMKPAEFLDMSFEGFKSMTFVTALVICSLVLQKVNDQLELTPYVIDKVEPLMASQFLPVCAFIVVAFVAFAAGSFWGLIAIATPIIIPLAQAMDANVFVAGSAIVSGAAFASHTLFYADAATLTCAATQISNIDYAKTCIPLAAVPFGISVILYTVCGFVM